METVFNSDYELIYHKIDEDKLFFKNRINDTLVQISNIEYEIINFYLNAEEVQKVTAHYSNTFEITDDFVIELVGRAKSINFLVTKGTTETTGIAKPVFGKVDYLTQLIVNPFSLFLNKAGFQIQWDLRGNFKFYKLFSVVFSKSNFEIFIRKTSVSFIYLYFFLLSIALLMLIKRFDYIPTLHELKDIPQPLGVIVFFVILLGILITTFFHEFGHYVLYSLFGGKTSSMGVALMVGILPVMYVSTNSLYLWTNKSHRIWVALAGILVDILLLILSVDLLLITSINAATFYIIFFIMLFSVRILANLNPFIPGTDGYFILADLISTPSLYQSATFNTVQFARNMRLFKFNAVDRKQLLSMLYLATSVVCITFYYVSIGLFILLPFAMRFIY